jgi:hypothetical protein
MFLCADEADSEEDPDERPTKKVAGVTGPPRMPIGPTYELPRSKNSASQQETVVATPSRSRQEDPVIPPSDPVISLPDPVISPSDPVVSPSGSQEEDAATLPRPEDFSDSSSSAFQSESLSLSMPRLKKKQLKEALDANSPEGISPSIRRSRPHPHSETTYSDTPNRFVSGAASNSRQQISAQDLADSLKEVSDQGQGVDSNWNKVFVRLEQLKEQNNDIIMMLRSKGFGHEEERTCADMLEEPCSTMEELENLSLRLEEDKVLRKKMVNISFLKGSLL